MASGPSGVAGAVLDGVDNATLGDVTAIPQRVVSGAAPDQRTARSRLCDAWLITSVPPKEAKFG